MPQDHDQATTSQRRHDLDWLRVLAILLLHVFHTGMFFNNWGWHIKNPDRLPVIELPMELMHLWRMPLLFFISGVGTILALRSRTILGFVRERHLRLLVPLIFGMIVIVPPQIYAERLTQGQHFASLWAFWRTVFQGVPYPEGNTSWHHLWFVLYLFFYAMLVTPLLAWGRSRSGAAFMARLRGVLASGATVWLLALPLAVTEIALRWRWPTTHNLVSDWANFSFHGLLFLYGTLIGFEERIWDHLTRYRRVSLGLAVATLGIGLIDDVRGIEGGYPYVWEYLMRSCLTWFCVLTCAGYGRRYLSFRNRFVALANEGIYPFYILHQTVIIVLAYPMIGWALAPWPKLVVLAVSSFVVSWAIYALLIRPWPCVRPFFGMKPRRGPTRRAEQPGRGSVAIGARQSTALQ